MAPRSPFDDKDDNDDRDQPDVDQSPKSSIPERKWSFIALGIVLFVFAWVRELARLPSGTSVVITLFLLFVWAAIHVWCYHRRLIVPVWWMGGVALALGGVIWLEDEADSFSTPVAFAVFVFVAGFVLFSAVTCVNALVSTLARRSRPRKPGFVPNLEPPSPVGEPDECE